ncbi:MAG: FAD binding domain-containing protein [Rubritepida sp.]|nr:FAD binding domain-containing protein [Rubritepida sp.]
MGRYWRPGELGEALAILAGEAPRLLAGGTDVYPALAQQAAWGPAATPDLLDLTGIAALRGIAREGSFWRLGALTPWATLRDAPPAPGFAALAEAARQVGGRQVQARGTIGGNLCNASPAADGVPPLLMLDALVELASPRGLRMLALQDFLRGNRRTARAADEILTAILVPAEMAEAPSVFLKLGARSHLVISIAMVAASANGRVAVGACSEVARLWEEGVAPIDDVRATAAYRRAAAAELVARARAKLAA